MFVSCSPRQSLRHWSRTRFAVTPRKRIVDLLDDVPQRSLAVNTSQDAACDRIEAECETHMPRVDRQFVAVVQRTLPSAGEIDVAPRRDGGLVAFVRGADGTNPACEA